MLVLAALRLLHRWRLQLGDVPSSPGSEILSHAPTPESEVDTPFQLFSRCTSKEYISDQMKSCDYVEGNRKQPPQEDGMAVFLPAPGVAPGRNILVRLVVLGDKDDLVRIRRTD